MSQGFNPYKHTVARAQASRWALFADLADDPLPTDPALLWRLTQALQGRIQRMDRTHDKRRSRLPAPPPDDIKALQEMVCEQLGVIARLDRTHKKQLATRLRLYIRVMSQRDRWPTVMEHNWRRLDLGHEALLYQEELAEIREGKLTAFGCLPAVLRLQRDHVYEYMARAGPDGYARSETPASWFTRNHQRLYEELAFWHCACSYCSMLDIHERALKTLKGPGELIPTILAALHTGCLPSSIRQMLKRSARPAKLPALLQ